MKLDKISFGAVASYISHRGAVMDHDALSHLDRLIEIDIPAVPVPSGVMNTDFVRQHIDNIFEALIEDRKIDAIRVYRAITALGLKDSKDVIEQFAREYRKHIAREIARRLNEAGYNDAVNFIKED